MRGKAAVVAWVGLILLSAQGCAPPEVTIHHKFPPAVELRPDVDSLRAGAFQITGKADEAVKQAAQKSLAEHIPQYAPLGPTHTMGAPHVVDVTGSVHVEIADTTGHRHVRRWAEGAKESKPIEVPSLRRRIRVRTVFDLASGKPPASLGAIEVRRKYDSATDTRVRGDQGLGRPDDPTHVPAPATVVAELLDECVLALHGMLRPVEHRVVVKMRSVGGSDTNKGFAAMRNAKYAEAGTHFAAALKDHGKTPAAHFNRAVAAEMAHHADHAVAHYGKVIALAPDDAEARAGLRRARRLQYLARQIPREKKK